MYLRLSILALNGGHLAFLAFGTVTYNCYNSLKNVPIGLTFLLMRISSSATNCTKGVCFDSAVLEKYASKIALDFTSRSI